MEDQVMLDGGSPPDNAPPEASATAEVRPEVKALYEAFTQAAVAQTVTNTTAAKASIFMLADALANMGGVQRVSQEQFNEIVGELLTYLEQMAMNLSHDISGIVEHILNPMTDEEVELAIADVAT